MGKIIENGGETPCGYKILETKNYYMEISKTLLYCFVVEPVKLQIVCNDWNLIYKLNETNLISYGNDCEVYKISNSTGYNSLVKNFAVDFSYMAPNFTVYDNILQNWTYDYALINRRYIEGLEAQAELIEYWNGNKDHKRILVYTWLYYGIDGISNFIGSIFEAMGNWLNTLFIKYFVVPVVCFLSIYLICMRVKRRSSPFITECK